jgi:hypothetical protein
MASTLEILRRLNANGVEFVLVGGMAGVLYGSSLVTEDIDVCAPFDTANLERIVASLRDLNPRHRMNPNHPPMVLDASSLAGFRNLYLLTDLGQIDILSELTGVGDYSQVSQHTIVANLKGLSSKVLDIETLIHARRAVGRPKDLQAAAELEALRERHHGPNDV